MPISLSNSLFRYRHVVPHSSRLIPLPSRLYPVPHDRHAAPVAVTEIYHRAALVVFYGGEDTKVRGQPSDPGVRHALIEWGSVLTTLNSLWDIAVSWGM